MQKDTSWNAVSEWYGDYLDSDNDSYHAKVIAPNLMRLLNIKPDENVLDIACGEGYFSREMAKAGGRVIALDASPNLISIAKQKSDPRIDFRVMSAENMSTLPDGHFDKAICVLAIQNIANLNLLVQEIRRVLKPTGVFVAVLNHPTFRVPHQSSWGFDEKTNTQYRRIDRYMSETKEEILMNPGGGKPIYTISFHRPLQTYFKHFDKAELAVVRLEEWISHKKSEAGPRQKAENTARHEIPMFLALVTKKIQ